MSKRPTLTLGSFKKNNTSSSADIVAKANESDISENNNNTQSVQYASDKKKSKVVTANAAKAKTQNLINDEDYQVILSYMQEHYPKCFSSKAEKPIALSIGLHHQLFAIENIPFSRMKIRKFLQRYTGSKEYRQSLIVGNDRFDLVGRPTSKILETEVNHWQWKRLQAEKKAEEIKKANHDSLIKKAMESPVAAKELLAEYLPAEFRDFIDLDTLTLEKESHIEDSLKTRFSDIVYSAKVKSNAKDNEDKDNDADKPEESALIYCLLEHQSSSDYWIALRLLKSSLLLLERHAKKRNKLPVIMPLVLYNGKKPYKAPLNLWELFAYPDMARKAISDNYNLIDLQAMSDDDIDYEKHLSFLLYTMKHIHDRDMLAMLKKAMQKCSKALIIDKGQDYVHTKLILWYTDAKVPEENKQLLEQLIVDNLPKEDTDNIMRTIADSYIDEGMNKGIAIGEARGEARGAEQGANTKAMEIAKRMLQENTDIKFISSVTGLSRDELLKIKNRI